MCKRNRLDLSHAGQITKCGEAAHADLPIASGRAFGGRDPDRRAQGSVVWTAFLGHVLPIPAGPRRGGAAKRSDASTFGILHFPSLVWPGSVVRFTDTLWSRTGRATASGLPGRDWRQSGRGQSEGCPTGTVLRRMDGHILLRAPTAQCETGRARPEVTAAICGQTGVLAPSGDH